MSEIHIGNRIKEVMKRQKVSVAELAGMIGMTRDGANKMLHKESIGVNQLRKICKVLDYDFFADIQGRPNQARENDPKYGYASREDVEALTRLVVTLARDVEKIQKNLSKLANSKAGKKKGK